MLCDFCSSPDPTWEYPARSFVAYTAGPVTGESVGSWAACEACHRLIEANDRVGLVARAMSRVRELGPEAARALRGCLHDLQARFFAHRVGPARRIRSGNGR
jgi:hypothetical protein